MRVGILSYPMLFQRDGGLQIQVRETIAALNRVEPCGGRRLQVELVDPNRHRLDDYALIHVFSAINGNHRIVESASEMGVPVILSPLLSPGWNRATGLRARVVDRLAGRLSAWNVQTSYAQTKRALQQSQLVIALGAAERDALVSGFLVDQRKIVVLPNGVSPQFFGADPGLFRRHSGIDGPFVLMAGAISPYKNQLGVAQALEGSALPLVLVGQAQRADHDYLQDLLGRPNVRWLGSLAHDDPLLASAFRAAAVLALPSQGEVQPLTVLEALAAGTPVVMTDQHALHLPASQFALREVRWDDGAALRQALLDLAGASPDRAAVAALVQAYTWPSVARQIAGHYFRVLEQGEEVRSAV